MPNILGGPIYQPPKNPLDEFDPNDRPQHPFATYCPSRFNGGKFKLHATRAHALSALNNQKVGSLYEWSSGRWEKLVQVDPVAFRPDRCESCNTGTLKHVETWDYTLSPPQRVPRTDLPKRNTIQQVFERRNGRLVEPLKVLSLCPDCRSGLGY
jgi:hypothetical protein